MKGSWIVVCRDLEYAVSKVTEDLEGVMIKTFFTDEFKVENASALLKEAYIAEEKQKVLLLCASEYNIYAQNALLKIFEEPPSDTHFILISRSKNSLLPTIRSRMPLKFLKVRKSENDLELDISRLDLASMYAFLKKNQNIKKDELLRVIERLFLECSVNPGLKLKGSELDLFDKAYELAQLNSRAQNVLSLLLLTIYEAKTRTV